MLNGKKILVGVCGSIAAYKSAYLIRLLVQSGAEVRVMMTPGALDFVTPLTFSTLSKHRVYSDFTENKNEGTWNHHVELGLWPDLILIAPISTNTLAKMSQGLCDSFFLATYMSARCPVMIAPAMDHDMYMHAATQENLDRVRSFGHQILSPNEGSLASGLVGKGRMAEPDEIYSAVVAHFNPALPLLGKKALVTAGPTYELIDPVRFIGNFSTGKMGFALATELANQGAEVTLICGPSSLQISHPRICRLDIVSGQQMLAQCTEHFPNSDIIVLAAAVADYRPKHQATEKIKKADSALQIELEPTADIAATLGLTKGENQRIIGFALETENGEANAKGKLTRKNFDMIVLNSPKDEGAGFGTETNKITLIWPDNKMQTFGLKAKSKVAVDIVTEIVKLLP